MEISRASALVSQAKQSLASCQSLLDSNPRDIQLKLQEKELMQHYSSLVLADEHFIKQKAKQRKSPGPDGFNAHFFHKAWPVIGNDVIKAIKDFFVTGKLLREVNNAYIALVLKYQNPSSLNDFHPISCCNTLYKCITKILANKLKQALPSTIDPCQNAFNKGRHIGDSVLLAQELLQGYHKHFSPLRCAIKVDLMKAFDSVGWEFLLDALDLFGFPLPFVFTANTKKFISQSTAFKFHLRCSNLAIAYLIFADDLLLFCRGDLASISTLKHALYHFSALSGLSSNNSKSSFFVSGVGTDLSNDIKALLGFNDGSLPIKYLGVPLLSTRLKVDDCHGLVERVTKRINHWSSNFLSYAGRIQLIQAVIYSTEYKHSGAKVNWVACCQPKEFGDYLIQHSPEICNIPSPSATENSIVWILSPSGVFTLSYTIEWLGAHNHPKPWQHLIWNTLSIPRCKFSQWLTVQNHLSTYDRASMRHFTGSRLCQFCGIVEESYNHLFFSCAFIRPIWIALQNKCRFHLSPSLWSDLVDRVASCWASNNLKNSVNKLALSTAINKIWQERNDRIFKNQTSNQISIFRQIMDLVRQRLLTTSIKDSPCARRLKLDWDLPEFIKPPPKSPDRAD
ncbi:uncharacterized protein LOC132281720 [Cornus florida]|uniref:uncharacterized protein LOC132281720 n=1 Tax=Cornus florida TaxID=4283 RepID=UPI0028A0CA06|nr:uncharacterized protein LOC132281720 [Cornus florida]